MMHAICCHDDNCTASKLGNSVPEPARHLSVRSLMFQDLWLNDSITVWGEHAICMSALLTVLGSMM